MATLHYPPAARSVGSTLQGPIQWHAYCRTIAPWRTLTDGRARLRGAGAVRPAARRRRGLLPVERRGGARGPARRPGRDAAPDRALCAGIRPDPGAARALRAGL